MDPNSTHSTLSSKPYYQVLLPSLYSRFTDANIRVFYYIPADTTRAIESKTSVRIPGFVSQTA